MENKIFYVSKKEMGKIKEEIIGDTDLFLAELNGQNVKTKQEYLDCVNHLFQFPTPAPNLGVYLDWITDLDWLGKEKYIFVIYDFSEFMKDDLETKVLLIQEFEEMVFPWWSGEVEKHSVGGKAKPFTVYLVD